MRSVKLYIGAFVADALKESFDALERRLDQKSAALESRLDQKSAALESRLSKSIGNVQTSLNELLRDHSLFYEQEVRRALLDHMLDGCGARLVPREFVFEASRFHRANQLKLLSNVLPDDLDFAVRCRDALEQQHVRNFMGKRIAFRDVEADCYTPNVVCTTADGIRFVMICAEVKYAIANLAALAHALLQALHVPLLVRFLLSHHTPREVGAGAHHVVASVVYRHLRLDDLELRRMLDRARMMCTHKDSHLHCHRSVATRLGTLISYFINQLGDWDLFLKPNSQLSGGSGFVATEVAVSDWRRIDITHAACKLEDLYSMITESELVEPSGSVRIALKNIPTLSVSDPLLSEGNASERQLRCSTARILCCLITANAMDLGHFHFQRLQSIGAD